MTARGSKQPLPYEMDEGIVEIITSDNQLDEDELEDLVDQRPLAGKTRRSSIIPCFGGSCRMGLLAILTLCLATGAGFLLGKSSVQDGAASKEEFESDAILEFDNEDEVETEGKKDVIHLTDLQRRQLQAYKDGTGLMVNLQIAHNGGSALCRTLGMSPTAVGYTPSFSCAGITPDDHVDTATYPSAIPWTAQETHDNIETVRQYFHFVTWHVNPTGIAQTDWEDPDLLSVLIMRDPMERLLSHDGRVEQQFPGVTTGGADEKMWLAYMHSNYTDNFAMQNLVSDGHDEICCNGAETDVAYLEKAKELISRFTIVLDLNCLNEGMTVLAYLTGLEAVNMEVPERPASVEDRINNDRIYASLLRQNQLDIALYEWSKSKSLVKCDKLPH